jgi:UDP-N-acetylglucosamine--N-acetylmuramyl-(pentapeptide) pyrophosphoryl-undecaprenol N-acetylglucosamine transferase
VTAPSGLKFVLAAGGTGGHLFPAEALARELVRQGNEVHLASDRRADAFAEKVPGINVCQVRAGRFGGGPLRVAYGVVEMAVGLVEARRLLRRLAPDAVIGFGGYASVPTMLAASQLGIPTIIHEQNAVLGRANRLLAPRASRIATGFAETAALRPTDRSRAVHTGNPVRPAILAAATVYTPRAPAQPIELLILGGSQGARIFSDVVPPALAALPAELRRALRVSQQARPEDRDRVVADLQAAGIAAEVETFFNDVPARLARAHLVICRSGASTISELAAAGRPAILVPYPHAMDDHQAANARAFAEAGAGWVMPQSSLTSALLTEQLTGLLRDGGTKLGEAATQAHRFGRDDAAERLAALAIALAPLVDGAKKRRAA